MAEPDELDKTIQLVVQDVEHYKDLSEFIPSEYLVGKNHIVSPQEIRDMAAYIINEQVDIDEAIIVRAVNFVRKKANA